MCFRPRCEDFCGIDGLTQPVQFAPPAMRLCIRQCAPTRGFSMKVSFRQSMAMSALVCAALAAASAVEAKTFKWANSGDVSSMDPYARQETFLLTFTQNIYDPLVRRDKNLKIEPALATKWGQIDKNTWFFDIRPNVKFSDGTPLNADDIVFSLNRANGPGSNMGSNFASVKEIK